MRLFSYGFPRIDFSWPDVTESWIVVFSVFNSKLENRQWYDFMYNLEEDVVLHMS